MTALGSALAWSRAARLGVSPTTSCSCGAPAATRSPMRTRPLAMPTLACSGPAYVVAKLDRQPRPARARRRLRAPRRPRSPADSRNTPTRRRPDTCATKPPCLFDHARATSPIGAHDFVKRLGVQPRGNRSRTDEVAEEDREMPALDAAVGTLVRRRRRLRIGVKARDRAQQPVAIAGRDPQPFEIVFREARKRRNIRCRYRTSRQRIRPCQSTSGSLRSWPRRPPFPPAHTIKRRTYICSTRRPPA